MPWWNFHEVLDGIHMVSDALGRYGRLGMSPGHGHRSERSSHAIVGLLAPDLLSMRAMARAAKKPSNERGRHDPQE